MSFNRKNKMLSTTSTNIDMSAKSNVIVFRTNNYRYIYFTSGGKSCSFIIAQFVSDNSSVGHFVALKD